MAAVSMMSAAFVPAFAEEAEPEVQQEEQMQPGGLIVSYPTKYYITDCVVPPELGEKISKYDLVPGEMYIAESYANIPCGNMPAVGRVRREVFIVLKTYEEYWFLDWFSNTMVWVVNMEDGKDHVYDCDDFRFYNFTENY